jgi:hypothetical protein
MRPLPRRPADVLNDRSLWLGQCRGFHARWQAHTNRFLRHDCQVGFACTHVKRGALLEMTPRRVDVCAV